MGHRMGHRMVIERGHRERSQRRTQEMLARYECNTGGGTLVGMVNIRGVSFGMGCVREMHFTPDAQERDCVAICIRLPGCAGRGCCVSR